MKEMIGIRIGKKIHVFNDPRPSKETIETIKSIGAFVGSAIVSTAAYLGAIYAVAIVADHM